MPESVAKTMNPDKLASLQRRYRTQKSLRSPLNSLWDDIDYFTGPVKDSGSTAQNPQGGTGSNLEVRGDLWDFTAIDGREKLAASIYGSACGNAYRWFFYGARDPETARDNESASWLSDESEACWNDLQDSDFNTEMPASLHELCGGGNCFLAMEPIEGEPEDYVDPKTKKKTIRTPWEGVDFTAIPVREGFFEPDRKGGIKTFWRRLMWLPSQVIDFCEEKGIPIPEDVKDKLEKASDVKIECVFCVFERPEILKRKKVRYPAAPDQRPYGFVWWREDTKEQLGEEGGYYEKTIFKGIWSKTAGSKWGHGPGNVALPTVKYVNGWKENLRAAGEKAVDPALLSEERNILSDTDFRSAGITIVRKIDGIKPLESASKFDVGEGMLERDQKAIRDIFHVDELQMKDSPAMTATEAQIRYEWMMRLLGKTLAFIQSYLLGPIVTNLLAARVRCGASRPMPKKLREAGGLMNVEYQGPLARSQRTDEVAAIERGMSFIAGLAQFYPEIRAAADPLQAVKTVFNRLGIPANILPPDEMIRKGMKTIMDSLQQAQAADTNQKNADAANKHADAKAKGGATNGAPLGGTPGPVVYPQLPPKPNLSPAGRVVGGGGLA
jgi:hypothetical protein